MTLLFDQNCSPKLVVRLSDLAPNSTQVALVGLDRADDRTVWDYALQAQLIIVTKDTDFNDLSVIMGTPPKVIWLQTGNCTTASIEQLLRTHWPAIQAFAADPAAALLTVIGDPAAIR